MRATPESRILQMHPAVRRRLALVSGAGILAALGFVVQAWLLSSTIARVFLEGATLSDVAPLLAGLVAVVLLRAALVWVSEIVAQRAASNLKGAARDAVARKLLQLGPAFTSAQCGGTLVQTATSSVEALDEFTSQYQPARALATAVPLMMLAAVLVIDPLTTLVLLFAGPILVLLLALIGQKTRVLTERRFAEMSWMGAYFLDMLRGLPTLKLFGRSREQATNIATIGARYGATTMDVLRTAFQTSLVLEWGATAATALVALEVSWRLLAGVLPFERALVVLLLTPEFFMPLRQLSLKYHAGTEGKAAAQQILALLDMPTSPAPAPGIAVPMRFNIQLDHVTLTYREGAPPALQDCSLAIPHGQVTALVGATGAGKSTIAQLLLGFVVPDHGRITVDGVPLNALDMAAWRATIGYVPQHPHLFDGTVAENIRLARPDADTDAVIAAAQAAHAHSFIMALPQGYATPLGEQGARLSGGQRQRIAIARALLKDAPLLIFDEATAHLDAATEAEVQAALARLMRGRTVLVIAHRLAMTYAADQIALIDGGAVATTGQHDDLLATNAHYQALVERYEGQLA